MAALVANASNNATTMSAGSPAARSRRHDMKHLLAFRTLRTCGSVRFGERRYTLVRGARGPGHLLDVSYARRLWILADAIGGIEDGSKGKDSAHDHLYGTA